MLGPKNATCYHVRRTFMSKVWLTSLLDEQAISSSLQITNKMLDIVSVSVLCATIIATKCLD